MGERDPCLFATLTSDFCKLPNLCNIGERTTFLDMQSSSTQGNETQAAKRLELFGQKELEVLS